MRELSAVKGAMRAKASRQRQSQRAAGGLRRGGAGRSLDTVDEEGRSAAGHGHS